MDMVKKGGARADKFFDFPEFQQVLDFGLYDLVIIMISGNDVLEDTNSDELAGHITRIHQAFTEKGTTCVMYTVEPSVYPQIILTTSTLNATERL